MLSLDNNLTPVWVDPSGDEFYVVNITSRAVPGSGGGDIPIFTSQWEFSATANEIAYAASHGKKVIGRRISSAASSSAIQKYFECLFGGIEGTNPVSVSFIEIGTAATYSHTAYGYASIATYTATGDSNIATQGIATLSGFSSLLVTFTHNNNGTWFADKTFAEIEAEIDNGAYVYATLSGTGVYYSLVTFSSPGNVAFWSPDASYNYLILFDDDTIYVDSDGYQSKSITDTGGYFTVDTVDDALQEIGAALASKGTYSKPSGGIPKTDLASDVQTSLDKADTAYQKPPDGIPASDLAPGVGVPAGGLPGMVLRKRSGVNYDTEWALNLPPVEVERFEFAASYDGQTDTYTVTRMLGVDDLWAAYDRGRTVEVRLYIDNGSEVLTTTTVYFEFMTVGADPDGAYINFNCGNDFSIYQLRKDPGRSWELALVPFSDVYSVNGQTGAVVLTASDVGAGTYSKPSGGIPKSDLADAVQTSLGKADTALQSAPVTSVNGQTGAVTINVPSLADYQPKSITDTGGYYTTDTVEGALQEIGAELAGINTLIGSGVIT